jgi:hypothetical protein
MKSSLSLSEAISSYDSLVEQLTTNKPTDEGDSIINNNNNNTDEQYQQLHRLCQILVQLKEIEPAIFSNEQATAIQTTMKHIQSRLEQVGSHLLVDDDVRITHWDRNSLTIQWHIEMVSIDCWDKEQLEEEEAMLIAMASTPIPQEMSAAASTDDR